MHWSHSAGNAHRAELRQPSFLKLYYAADFGLHLASAPCKRCSDPLLREVGRRAQASSPVRRQRSILRVQSCQHVTRLWKRLLLRHAQHPAGAARRRLAALAQSVRWRLLPLRLPHCLSRELMWTRCGCGGLCRRCTPNSVLSKSRTCAGCSMLNAFSMLCYSVFHTAAERGVQVWRLLCA
jgi:hypothetical protein